MTTDEFANTIKAQYPQYNNVDNNTLAQHMIARYPVYASKITPAAAPQKPALGQGSMGEFAGNAVRAVASPLVRTGGLIEKGLDNTLGRVGNAITGHGFTPTNTGNQAQMAANSIDAGADKTAAGSAGTILGNVAPYLTPGLGEEAGATQGAGLLAKAANYGARVAPTVARDTAIGTAQTGSLGQGIGIGATTGALRGVGDLVKAKTVTSPLQKATDAINPDLSGKAKINAYKQVANGREAKPAGVLNPQSLSPSERTVNTAKRLANDTQLSDGSKVSGVKFGKNPVQNLKTVGKSLNETEGKLTSHPDMALPLKKDSLVSKLDALREGKPLDFIGDNGKIYDNVVSYAQKVVNDSGDTIGEGRSARTAFDQEAARRFPTAFKNGILDTSTPAGSAIKTVRDAMNEHLYATAPHGSDLQSLVGREADLLHARDISATKAASLHGSNWFKQFAKQRPLLAKTLGYGLIAAGGGEVAKMASP